MDNELYDFCREEVGFELTLWQGGGGGRGISSSIFQVELTVTNRRALQYMFTWFLVSPLFSSSQPGMKPKLL